jgi:hypothetical protein
LLGAIVSVYGALEWLFGIPCLIVGLAVVAAIPVVQLLSLGYLLEVCGHSARTARWRDGLPRAKGLAGVCLYLWQLLTVRMPSCLIGARKAARLGAVILGIWLLLLPLRLVSSLALSAELIDPQGVTGRRWRAGLALLSGVTVLAIFTLLYLLVIGSRIIADWWAGRPVRILDRLRHGGWYTEARDGVWDFVASLRVPYYLWLGLRGFVGTMAWLVLPISLFAAGRLIGQQGTQQAGGVGFLVGFAGAVQLMFVLLQLPFLQARFAAENRFKALFQWGDVVRGYGRAPLAFALALVVTILSAVPLYLLKIEMIPREATGLQGLRFGHLARLLLLDQTLLACLPELVFVVFIFPAKLVTGWAYARSVRPLRSRHWVFTVARRLCIVTAPAVMLPAVAFYVLIVFLSQYTSWNGVWSLYEQHAFLLPVPFVGR